MGFSPDPQARVRCLHLSKRCLQCHLQHEFTINIKTNLLQGWFAHDQVDMTLRIKILREKGSGFILIFLLLGILSGCVLPMESIFPGDPVNTTTSRMIPKLSVTPTATRTATATSQPTAQPTLARTMPTATPKPPPTFQTDTLYRGIEPVNYLQNTCQYLYDRWHPDHASPGTVVVPIMYHGIRKAGGSVQDNITVTQKYFEETMQHARELGYETITMQQLEKFLQHNAYIPPLSMLLIIDDRRLGTVREHFLPVLAENHWTLTMAYITGVINQQEWRQVKEVLATGLVEIQAHGYLHNGETYFTEYTPEEIIHTEIYGPIDAFEENLGYRPTAFIFPGGDFTPRSVEVVREAGYQLGFTIHARGPIMFNWIPQGEKERTIGEPLLTLPRYWSTSAYDSLDSALELGRAAAAFAGKQRMSELSWYSNYCGDYPPIPLPLYEGTCESCQK